MHAQRIRVQDLTETKKDQETLSGFHFLYDTVVMWRKTVKHAFSMFYTLIKHGFLSNQSARWVLSNCNLL